MTRRRWRETATRLDDTDVGYNKHGSRRINRTLSKAAVLVHDTEGIENFQNRKQRCSIFRRCILHFSPKPTAVRSPVSRFLFPQNTPRLAVILLRPASPLGLSRSCRTFSLRGTALLAISRRSAVLGSSITLSRVEYFWRKSSFSRAGTNSALHAVSSCAWGDESKREGSPRR